MSLVIVTLDKFSYGGDSFGRLEDHRAVFVPYSLPGERVKTRLVEEKRSYARGVLIEVLETSPDRIDPQCPHFVQCGGCHYQHIPYEVQLQAKADILQDQLRRIGKIENPPIHPTFPSPTPWNYRNHVQFHITPDNELGFQAPRSHKVIPIRECHLPEESINQIWPLLDIDSIPGLDRLILRVGDCEDVLIILESSDPHPVALEVDMPISVVHTGPGGSLILAGDNYINIEVEGREFRVSSGSFFQVNTEMAGKMVRHILSNLSIPKNATLIDAYCGVGLLSAFFAPHVDRLIGIESSPSACEDFVFNLDEFDNVELYEASVEDVLPTLDVEPDILIADPPRSGIGHRTLDAILALGPGRIIYVSCDPATLSRDAKRLVEGGYHHDKITPFDLFPQTYHIESISFWSKI